MLLSAPTYWLLGKRKSQAKMATIATQWSLFPNLYPLTAGWVVVMTCFVEVCDVLNVCEFILL